MLILSYTKKVNVISDSIFERVEKKYILSGENYKDILPYIEEYCVPDAYPESFICSVYYDTPDSRIIRTSIDKPAYKEKLRIRSYGTPDDDTKVYVEIKKKVKGVVYKRRVHMKYKNALAFLNDNAPPPHPCQITKEIEYFKTFYGNIQPAMFVSYHRLSYISKDDPNLRITFDDDVTTRETDLYLHKGIYGDKILPEDVKLMEVKTTGTMPLWLAHAFDKCKIYPGSFSKYGTAYTNSLKEKLIDKGVIFNA